MSFVDMRIDIDDFSPNSFPVTPRRSVSLPSFTDFRGVHRNLRFSYSKLPEEPLKLSVLKLDGSFFDIEVMKTATVAELRQAVEDAFSYMRQKGPGKISWPHVWSHFCLTYDGRKLVIDTDNIRNYGIRDGDQLQFIQHISNSFMKKKKLKKKRSTKRVAALEHHEISPSSPDMYDEREERTGDSFDDVENGVHLSYSYNEIENSIEKKENRNRKEIVPTDPNRVELNFRASLEEYTVTDLRTAGLEEVDFGWGKPVYAGPPFSAPNINFHLSFNHKDGEKGIMVPICLPTKSMEIFEHELDIYSILKGLPISGVDHSVAKSKL